jgi:multiple sugar transport system ATP-binding protein
MADIALEGLTKRYADGTEAVKGIDLEVADGEFMIFVGPSGCGKTTALRMIAGLEEITDGTVRIGPRVVNDLAPKQRDIAMVFQNYALYPHMTVRDNIGFALRLAKMDKRERAQRVQDAVRMLDLAEHLDRRPAQLSGGQRQRVAIGRAMVRNPHAFLMDEPLSNLDAKLRVQMRLEISRLQARLNTTTVYVTHDQTEAMTLGDRLAVMRGGVIHQLGSPTLLYDHPANVFVAGFIGSPPMNFVSAGLVDDELRLPFGATLLPAELRERLSSAAARGDVIVGIRPEAFEDAALAGDTRDTLPFRTRIDVVESMGHELFAHFTVADRLTPSSALTELEEDEVGNLGVADGMHRLVARLDARSRASAGTEIELLLRASAITLFDPKTGESLLVARD